MINMKRILYLLLVATFCLGCQERPNDGRMVEKFLSRLNAREYGCASQYIFPGDHPKLKLFAEVMTKNPDTFFKLISKENASVDGKAAVKVRLECINPTPYFRNYMEALKKMGQDCIIEDIWLIRETTDGNTMSFNWANIKGDNLMLARLEDSASIPVFRSQSKNSTQINTFQSGEKVIINDYPADSPWVRCFKTDDNCKLVNGYIERSRIATAEGRFFNLNIFDTLSLLVAAVLFLVFGALFFLIRLIVEVLMGSGCMAWIVIPTLILAWLFVLYQLLEKILFEVFIINLPY